MRPRYRAEHYADLGKVAFILKLLKHAMIQIGLKVEDTLSAIFQLHVDFIIV